ncbi:hypothetical protein [Allobaculum sp. Allo2]|uniref:hypothetical protein n=1 Tax=Allobaculum sp. Allo2 TaxID=2853432 RepID=UPI001F611EC8|nr:hypothetical protein [Allobaculum sp. Allo2]
MDKYYLVNSSILPDVIEKVVEAQNLLNSGKVRRICEAVREVGISRERTINIRIPFFSLSPRTQAAGRFFHSSFRMKKACFPSS